MQFSICLAAEQTMSADNNMLTPAQMAARIAELEGRLAKNQYTQLQGI
jgi:hypothetical protein